MKTHSYTDRIPPTVEPIPSRPLKPEPLPIGGGQQPEKPNRVHAEHQSQHGLGHGPELIH